VATLQFTTVASPIGALTLVANGSQVCLLEFGGVDRLRERLSRWYPGAKVEEHRDPAGAASVLQRYFDGDLESLDTVQVELHGTPFQRNVWEGLRSVRAGTTASYAELARRVGAPAAVRAVGAANGANPVSLVLPCHRIIGSNGSLTGYGGGLDRKRWLLAHEGALLNV
jgi:methylated-DNA-[protein]-cysteine S-methyltransferase